MTEILPAIDTPPEEWVEHFDLELTEEEIAKGNYIGEEIDIDDDKDNGLEE